LIGVVNLFPKQIAKDYLFKLILVGVGFFFATVQNMRLKNVHKSRVSVMRPYIRHATFKFVKNFSQEHIFRPCKKKMLKKPLPRRDT